MSMILSLLMVCLSISFLYIFKYFADKARLMDLPNDRSLHHYPTVRGGGVVFIGLFLFSFPFFAHYATSWDILLIFMLSTAALALVSFIDDLYHLSAKLRFLVQSVAALFVIIFIKPEEINFIFFSFTNQYVIGILLYLILLWAINHFNFMDGLDGFCTLQAVFLLFTYAFFFSSNADILYQNLCWVLGCGLLGFLVFNFPPAKVFMGDVGSASLGFIIFVLAIIGQKDHQIPIMYWFILNGLFLFDATITLLRRVLNKEKWFIAHKKHAYQRLRQFGFSARKILFGQAVLNLIFLILLILFHFHIVNLPIILITELGIILLIYFIIERRFPMYQYRD